MKRKNLLLQAAIFLFFWAAVCDTYAQDKPVFTIANVDIQARDYIVLERDRMELSREDILDEQGLAFRFKTAPDPFTKMLKDKFSASTLEKLETYQVGTQPDNGLLNDLIHDLNQLIEGPSLYDESVFKAQFEQMQGVRQLPVGIQKSVEEHSRGALVNRPLIDYVYFKSLLIKKYQNTLFKLLDEEFKAYDQFDYRNPDEINLFQNIKTRAEVGMGTDTAALAQLNLVGYDEGELLRDATSGDNMEQLKLKGADYMVFATMSPYISGGLTSLMTKGAILLQLTYIDIETREVYTLTVGETSPIPLSQNASQSGPVSVEEVDEAYRKLAKSAAHALEISFGENNQKAIDLLTELRFMDIDIKALERPKKMELMVQVFGGVLSAVGVAHIAGVFGTANASPYGKANFLSAFSMHSGFFLVYAMNGPKFMKPFMKIKRNSLQRQYRHLTGNDVPALYK